MKTSDFKFNLPDSLIARFPMAQRSASRLLCLDGSQGAVEHKIFRDIENLLEPGDLLVFNNTKVIPARLFGEKSSGGKLEVLIERIVSPNEALAHIRCSRSPKPGQIIYLGGGEGSGDKDPDVNGTSADAENAEAKGTKIEGTEVEVLGREGALFHLKFKTDKPLLELLDEVGHMPLPPYMERDDSADDKERYQTVYAAKPGAVAAPTAGLHFDDALLARLKRKGVQFAYVTLHVGAGTFQPVKVDNIHDHIMHSEYIEVPQAVVDAVQQTRARGKRVVAVGTTSVRSLESASQQGEIAAFYDDSDIFIYPGYAFRSVDAMITNFHLPESTLIMLVSAFAGKDQVMAAYQQAIAEQYRFYSYGDAMFVTPAQSQLSNTQGDH